MYNPDNYLAGSSVGDLFYLLANCSLLFCSDLAVLIFPLPFADIERPNRMSAQSPRVGTYSYLTPSPSIILL